MLFSSGSSTIRPTDSSEWISSRDCLPFDAGSHQFNHIRKSVRFEPSFNSVVTCYLRSVYIQVYWTRRAGLGDTWWPGIAQ